jgi:molybdenum cofactor cytidylyltransferase
MAVFRGETLVRRVAAAATEAGCAPVVIVVGEEAAEIRAELAGTSVMVIENTNWKEGLGSSVRVGVEQAQREEIEAAVLLACDQPLVDANVIRSLVELARNSGKPIVASAYGGTVGIPALFRRSEFSALRALQGDRGAKSFIQSRAEGLAIFDFPEGAIDIDTPEDFARIGGSRIGGSRPPGAI